MNHVLLSMNTTTKTLSIWRDTLQSATKRSMKGKQFGCRVVLFVIGQPVQNNSLESHRKIDSHSKDYKTYNSDNLSFVVTFYSGNRVEWVLSDLACSSNSITSTALYDTLGHDASKYILKSTESPVIISSKEHIRGLIDLKKEDPQGLASIILIVSMEPLTQKGSTLGGFC